MELFSLDKSLLLCQRLARGSLFCQAWLSLACLAFLSLDRLAPVLLRLVSHHSEQKLEGETNRGRTGDEQKNSRNSDHDLDHKSPPPVPWRIGGKSEVRTSCGLFVCEGVLEN